MWEMDVGKEKGEVDREYEDEIKVERIQAF